MERRLHHLAIYPLTEEKFQEIVRDVAARRAERVATAQETPEQGR